MGSIPHPCQSQTGGPIIGLFLKIFCSGVTFHLFPPSLNTVTPPDSHRRTFVKKFKGRVDPMVTTLPARFRPPPPPLNGTESLLRSAVPTQTPIEEPRALCSSPSEARATPENGWHHSPSPLWAAVPYSTEAVRCIVQGRDYPGDTPGIRCASGSACVARAGAIRTDCPGGIAMPGRDSDSAGGQGKAPASVGSAGAVLSVGLG
jgi:hypothetical protein